MRTRVASRRKPSETMRNAVRAMSALMERWKLSAMVGMMFGGKRDLYKVFGYDKNLDADKCMARYERQDIVARVVDAPPSATWSSPPVLKAGSRNVAWLNNHVKPLKLWTAMERVDRLARLGRFSILVMGFNDGK